jgi:hypothetical protein
MTLLWCHTRQQASADSSPGGESPRPPPPHEPKEEGPPLSHITMLPLSLWREHIRPLLHFREAMRLRRVCKALKVSMREWSMRLGERPDTHLSHVAPEVLEVALKCFPAMESFGITLAEPLAPTEESRMVELFRGHGEFIKRVRTEHKGARRLLTSAVRAAALTKLTYFDFNLGKPFHRQILSGGMLRLLEEVCVTVDPYRAGEEPAALEHLRRIPQLQRLELVCNATVRGVASFPPFIPPSLRSLTLSTQASATLEQLLRELPGMLQTSRASLEAIELRGVDGLDAKLDDECGAALLQVLRMCSPTLKRIELVDNGRALGAAGIRDLWPCLMSCCATLEVLHVPLDIFSALPATCPSFLCLAELELNGRGGVVDNVSPVWAIMANGGLPSLVTITVSCGNEVPVEGEGVVLVRAFQAVAGTLRKLTLYCAWRRDSGDFRANYELGAAVGKLSRLRYLKLAVASDGRAYHALGRGMAASGGCPQLHHVCLFGLMKNVHWLTSTPNLFVPSVRELFIGANSCPGEEALLLCCGLVQTGYKHWVGMTFLYSPNGEYTPSVLDCMRAILRGGCMKRTNISSS